MPTANSRTVVAGSESVFNSRLFLQPYSMAVRNVNFLTSSWLRASWSLDGEVRRPRFLVPARPPRCPDPHRRRQSTPLLRAPSSQGPAASCLSPGDLPSRARVRQRSLAGCGGGMRLSSLESHNVTLCLDTLWCGVVIWAPNEHEIWKGKRHGRYRDSR